MSRSSAQGLRRVLRIRQQQEQCDVYNCADLDIIILAGEWLEGAAEKAHTERAENDDDAGSCEGGADNLGPRSRCRSKSTV